MKDVCLPLGETFKMHQALGLSYKNNTRRTDFAGNVSRSVFVGSNRGFWRMYWMIGNQSYVHTAAKSRNRS